MNLSTASKLKKRACADGVAGEHNNPFEEERATLCTIFKNVIIQYFKQKLMKIVISYITQAHSPASQDWLQLLTSECTFWQSWCFIGAMC